MGAYSSGWGLQHWMTVLGSCRAVRCAAEALELRSCISVLSALLQHTPRSFFAGWHGPEVHVRMTLSVSTAA